jgi:hypothetical protein
MKICTRCHIEKRNGDFYRSKAYADGRHPRCKQCFSEVYKKRYSRRMTKKEREDIFSRIRIVLSDWEERFAELKRRREFK